MTTLKQRLITSKMVKQYSENIGLYISDERSEIITPVFEQITTMLAELDNIDLNDTPPSCSYRANWKP